MAPVHAIAPRLREGDDGFAVEEAADVDPPRILDDLPAPANGASVAGESSSSGSSSQLAQQVRFSC